MCTATFTHTVCDFLLQLPDANQHKQNLVITRAHENRSRCLLLHAHKTADFHYPVKKVCVSLGMWLFLVKLNAPINVAMHDSNERRTQNITTGKFKTCNIEGRSQLYMSTLLAREPDTSFFTGLCIFEVMSQRKLQNRVCKTARSGGCVAWLIKCTLCRPQILLMFCNHTRTTANVSRSVMRAPRVLRESREPRVLGAPGAPGAPGTPRSPRAAREPHARHAP